MLTRCSCLSEVDRVFKEPPFLEHAFWHVPLVSKEFRINGETPNFSGERRTFEYRGRKEVFGTFIAWYYEEV